MGAGAPSSNTARVAPFIAVSRVKAMPVISARSIIYISHRLEELTRIADYVSVLRDGKMQSSARMREVDVPWIDLPGL